MFRTLAPLIALIATAGFVLAHAGVTNQTVMARMHLMEGVAEATQTLGNMARGRADFDAERAAQAQAWIINAAKEVETAFQAPETDPKSEALPAIWTSFDDFLAKSTAMGDAAAAMDTSSLDGVRAGMRQLGATCGACHSLYRLEK